MSALETRAEVQFTMVGRALQWAAGRVARAAERGKWWARPAAAALVWAFFRLPAVKIR